MTSLLYLKDTFKFESVARIIEMGNDSKGNYIILNETIFYPQSGKICHYTENFNSNEIQK